MKTMHTDINKWNAFQMEQIERYFAHVRAVEKANHRAAAGRVRWQEPAFNQAGLDGIRHTPCAEGAE